MISAWALLGHGAMAQSFLEDSASAMLNGEGEGKSFINQYSKKYKSVTDEDLAHIKNKNLLTGNKYTVQFVRHPEDAYGIVTLRLESPLTIQGCGSSHIPYVELNQKGRTIEIEMGKPELLPGAEMRYPHYECEITNGTPRIDVPISRNDLIASRVNRLKLKAGTAFDAYDVVLGDNNIMLTPLTTNSFTPAERENALNHVFYPVNMVLLRVPGGAEDEGLPEKMDLLAKRHKLIPVEKPIPNAKPYQFYALDKDYNVMLPLQKDGMTKLDTITVEDIFYGANGPYTISRKADVFVTLPGEFD